MSVPWPGISANVSRGIESREAFPPPTRISRIVSERLGPPTLAPGSFVPLVRASEPSTRMLFGEVSGKPESLRVEPAASLTFWRWTWAETRNSSSEISTQPTAARAT